MVSEHPSSLPYEEKHGCEHFKIPSVLADPHDNKQQKASNTVFSFPYRDKHFTQKRAAPIPAFFLYYLLSYSTCLSLRFGNEERRCMMLHSPFLAVAGARKGRVYITQVITHHEKTLVGSLCSKHFVAKRKQTQRPFLNAASHSLKSQSVPDVLLHNGGGWPHTCVHGVTEQCWAHTLKV